MNLLCLYIFDENGFHKLDFEKKLITSISEGALSIHDSPTDDQRLYLRIGCRNQQDGENGILVA